MLMSTVFTGPPYRSDAAIAEARCRLRIRSRLNQIGIRRRVRPARSSTETTGGAIQFARGPRDLVPEASTH